MTLTPSQGCPNTDTVLVSASGSQDGKLEDRHDCSTDYARNGDRDKPGHENVAEESPVNSLFGSEPANGHDRAHLGGKGARDWSLSAVRPWQTRMTLRMSP